MDMKELQSALEAVLFAAGESVHESKLCAVLEIEKDLLTEAAKRLADEYDFGRRGIKLIKLENAYQLCSRPDFAPYVRSVLETRRTNALSQSALEVLAIIAYKQPITKTYVEQVRGVDSTYTVNSLSDKGLIEDCGRLDVPGRPMLYRTTEAFLRAFGLTGISDLPEFGMFVNEKSEQMTLNMPMEA